jgi:hypothetical protein
VKDSLKYSTVLAMLLLLACRPSFKEVKQETVRFSGPDGQTYQAMLYSHSKRAIEGGVIICPDRPAEAERWNATAMRMTWQHYTVLHHIQTAAGDSILDTAAGAAAVQAANLFLQNRFAKIKIGVLGAGAAAWIAVAAGVRDSTISAAILLTPSWPALAGEQDISAWQGRPLVLIAPEQDPQKPASAIDSFYQSMPDPKKLVWLATDQTGSNLLDSHYEPIVRRVAVLLFDRWLRGKM